MTPAAIPHLRVPHSATIIAFCVAAITGYSVFSVWAVFYSDDAGLRGDVIGTWKSFAVAAFTFWLGSSSGGKSKDTEPRQVEVMNAPSNPVPTVDETGVLPSPEFGPRPGGE